METMTAPIGEKTLASGQGKTLRRDTNISSDEKNVDMSLAEKMDRSFIPSSGEELSSADNHEVVSTANDLVTHIIRVEDDPTISPWTFRMVFLGIAC